MSRAEAFNAAEGAREGIASRALHRLQQVGRMVMGMFDMANPHYDRAMDLLSQPRKTVRRAIADSILKR